MDNTSSPLLTQSLYRLVYIYRLNFSQALRFFVTQTAAGAQRIARKKKQITPAMGRRRKRRRRTRGNKSYYKCASAPPTFDISRCGRSPQVSLLPLRVVFFSAVSLSLSISRPLWVRRKKKRERCTFNYGRSRDTS